ncbi:hypothetical protein BTI_5643 [Burkholderia thailandensis MSMB121]|uniref:hypothetical protein n=1 Tax=Burkholderia humptydooensis TaxID=430531 RepID=UPI000327F13E|nr:hypothetical protein [Burkholderia humptydooensis]AGK50125.1 hypothetical protein BTI_5643 [Burkholderia thailandensis MSMB121]KST70871.1 hypothetical protein WS76_19820 [Burkholderia humptydooensis]
MGMLDDEQLKAVHASLAPVVERLSEASATLASSAVPLLGVPPATAPPAAAPPATAPPAAVPLATAPPAGVQLATQLSAHAAPVALAAPLVSQSIPALSQPVRT